MVKRRGADAGIADLHRMRSAILGARVPGGWGNEGDLMLLGGWRSRAMLDRYPRRQPQIGLRSVSTSFARRPNLANEHGGLRSRPPPPQWVVRLAAARPGLHARRTVQVWDLPIGGPRGCWPGASGSGAVVGRPVRSRPGPRGRPQSGLGQCRRAGPGRGVPAGRQDAHAAAAVAPDLGVGWATIMWAVADHGGPLLEDPAPGDGVAALGLDATSFLKATRLVPTRWITGAGRPGARPSCWM
jgi:hypothetical protein